MSASHGAQKEAAPRILVLGPVKPEVTKQKKRRNRSGRKKNIENKSTAEACGKLQPSTNAKNLPAPNGMVQLNTTSTTVKAYQPQEVQANARASGKLVASITSILNKKPVASAATLGVAGSSSTPNAVKKPKNKYFRRTRIPDVGGGGGNSKVLAVGNREHIIKNYGKVRAQFQCENEDCRKQWSSAHGWTSRPDELCYDCGRKAKVVNIESGMMWVETFRCNGYHGPEGETNCWISLTDYSMENPCPLMIMDCDICGRSTTSGGPQYRFGRHFWYKCQNPDCGEEWEDAQTEAEYTQHCSKCNRPGNQLGFRKETTQEQAQRAARGRFGGGGHNVNGCDMCLRLQKDGVARNCTMQNRVAISTTHENGVSNDRVISVQ